jgi:hypothetical protein
METARMARGFLWGAVATVLMTCTHTAIWAVQGRLTVHAFETQAMPAIIITKMFGPGLPASTLFCWRCYFTWATVASVEPSYLDSRPRLPFGRV